MPLFAQDRSPKTASMAQAQENVRLELPRVVPADPFLLARMLAPRGGLSVLFSGGTPTWTGDPQVSYVAVSPRTVSHALVPEDAEALREVGYAGGGAAPRWIGILPYEHFRGLERSSWTKPDLRPPAALGRPTWLRYDACIRVGEGRVVIEADSATAAAELSNDIIVGLRAPPPLARFALTRLLGNKEDELRAAHARRIEHALRMIAQGDVYQVNLARRLCYELQGDPLSAFASWMQRAPAPFGFFGSFDGTTVLGGSPELALSVSRSNMWTCPIKGTRPRGVDAAADSELEEELDASEKERAELTMAVDLHRNDLGKVAAFGSVRVSGEPRIVRGPRVMSRVAQITARRAVGATLEDCLRACLPCGSVTGAPKVRAMELISELEPHRRGLYTGAYGFIGRDGAMTLAMAIRTATLTAPGDSQGAACEAEYFSGGGIVAGSIPQAEVRETEWKALENLAPQDHSR
jgi:anthranilate/para-aminobenzoate synthase component I